MENIYWIGARRSDIMQEELFTGSITRYGEKDNEFHFSFCNNSYTRDYELFLHSTINNIIRNDKNCRFMFANQSKAYEFGEEIYHKSICVNSISKIDAMNNKIFMRNCLHETVNTPPSISINGRSAKDYMFIKSVFNNRYSEFILQEPFSSGGADTFLLSKPNDLLSIEPYTQVLVTPFYENNIPVNVHILTTKNDYRIFPPSVQIVLEKYKYAGSDFLKYHELNKKTRSKILEASQKVAETMVAFQCIGIFGIDFLIVQDDVFFLECNFRYQGSTFLLNKALNENNYDSTFNLEYKAFNNLQTQLPLNIHELEIPYSGFRRTKQNIKVKLPNPVQLLKDSDLSSDFSQDNYIQHELFNCSIYDVIEKS